MRRNRPLFPMLLLALVAPPAAGQPVGIHWQQDIESAKTLARDTGRLVLVHFWTPTCAPCMMLEQNVFNQPGVGTAIEAQFVPVKLDANENSATAVGFGISRVPTDVVITPDGEMVGQLISPPTPSAYVGELSQLASQYATRQGQTFARAADAAPFEPPQYVNPAYANLPLADQARPGAAINPTAADPSRSLAAGPPAAYAGYSPSTSPATGGYVGSVPSSAAAQPGAYAAPNASPTSPATSNSMSTAPTPAVVANRYASLPAASTTVSPATPTPTQQANPYVASPQAANSSATPPASAAAPDSRRLPAGAPPLGFDGYCPVSMRNHWKWVPGNPDYGIIHRGRTYWFAGPEEQKQFWSNPDHYSPALSGLDPVLAVDHKQQVPGKREHSLDYDNLFYLFSSEATLQQFAANPERYAVSVRQAMGIQRGRFVR